MRDKLESLFSLDLCNFIVQLQQAKTQDNYNGLLDIKEIFLQKNEFI